jgi:hypothetical protein
MLLFHHQFTILWLQSESRWWFSNDPTGTAMHEGSLAYKGNGGQRTAQSTARWSITLIVFHIRIHSSVALSYINLKVAESSQRTVWYLHIANSGTSLSGLRPGCILQASPKYTLSGIERSSTSFGSGIVQEGLW